MTTKLNKVRYLKLLEKDQRLKNQNSCLYYEDKMEYRELLSYGIILENQILYNRRHDFISLLESYITNEIDDLSLRFKFFQIRRESLKIRDDLQKNFEKLLNVSIDSKSAEVSPLIKDIDSYCELCDFDSEDDERKFRTCIEDTFLKLKPYKDSEKFPMDDSLEISSQVPEPYFTWIRLILISLIASGTVLLSIDFIK